MESIDLRSRVYQDQEEKFDYSDTMINKLQEYYRANPSALSDIIILASDGVEIKTHKFLLSLTSDFFKAMFKFEPNKKIFEIKNFDSKVLSTVIQSMVKIDFEAIEEVGLMEMLEAATYFQMKSLAHVLSTYILKSEASVENVIDLIIYNQSLNDQTMLSGCSFVIKQNYEKVFKSGLLKTLDISSLLSVFKEAKHEDLSFRSTKSIQDFNSPDELQIEIHYAKYLVEVLEEQEKLDYLTKFIDECFTKDEFYLATTLDMSIGKYVITIP